MRKLHILCVMINSRLCATLVAHCHQKIAQVSGIYLFGSMVSGETHAASDVDLGLLCHEEVEAVQLWDVAQDLAVLAGRDVDVIDLRAASTVMRMQVLAKGSRIACFDEPACEVFEDFVFSDYARLNEERAGILQDIGKRGRVYG